MRKRLFLLLALLFCLIGCTDDAVLTPTTVAPSTTQPTRSSTPSPISIAPTTTKLPPTPTLAPTPTEAFAVFSDAPEAVAHPVAYVEDGVLRVLLPGADAEPTALDSCPADATACTYSWLQWSPAGDGRLLYFQDFVDAYGFPRSTLRVALPSGDIVVVSTNALHMTTWSPDGSQVAFMQDGGWTRSGPNGEEQMRGVLTTDIEPDGTLGNWQRVGFVGVFDKCASPALSISGGLRAMEQPAFTFVWSAENIILHTNSCLGGIGRFDIASGEELTPYTEPLRQLTLNADRNEWLALLDGALAQGAPDSTEIAQLALDQNPTSVYFGQDDQRWFTVQQTSSTENYNAQIAADVAFSTLIDPTTTQLFNISNVGTPELVLESDSYAITRLTHLPDGSVWFVSVENAVNLVSAIEEGISAERLTNFLPSSNISQLTNTLEGITEWRPRAGMLTIDVNR